MSLVDPSGDGSARMPPEMGPYVLQTLVADLPLSADGGSEAVKINCVEFLDHNLYIGTSASEILHFFQIPPDPSSPSQSPTFILASRLSPAYAPSTISKEQPGVQQILLLPSVNKACVLCNWTVNFYSLPELSPVFGGVQVRNCSWIGGIDLNIDQRDAASGNGVTILMSHNTVIRVIRIGEEPRKIRSVEFAGSKISVRRDSFACVADSRAYALLDVDRRLKIPLFPISSLDSSHSSNIGGQVEDISGTDPSGSQRGHRTSLSVDDRGHARSSSLGAFIGGQSRPGNRDSFFGGDTPEGIFRNPSPTPDSAPVQYGSSPGTATDKPLPIPPSDVAAVQSSPPVEPVYLKPHVISPSPQEFLLVTGTGPSDPGVGMFVNLDGDVTRSTLEFDHYPDAIVADGRGVGIDLTPLNAEESKEGYVLAAMTRQLNGRASSGLEIQRWDLDPSEVKSDKHWLELSSFEKTDPATQPDLGIRSLTGPGDVYFEEVVDRLCLKRFHPTPTRSMNMSSTSLRSVDSRTAKSLEQVSKEQALFESQDTSDDEATGDDGRLEEERAFAQRLAQSRSRVVIWSGNKIWWVVRSPLALQLESALVQEEARLMLPDSSFDRRKIIDIVNSLRGREATTEAEFIGLGYIRQRAGLLLFVSFLHSPNAPPTGSEYSATEDTLLDSGLDPRVIMALVPQLRGDVVQSKAGIWIHGGVQSMAEAYILNQIHAGDASPLHALHEHVLRFLRQYLAAWRRKKGFGSVANDPQVFQSIDAALLIVLIELDKASPSGPARPASVRAELNEMVDHGVDCFDRAVTILESYQRLYLLSRLYQSRRMASEVLATWKRIIEGQPDKGGEFLDGEQRLREHLSRLSNSELVQEYGIWLANRNPKLGVQVFADDKSKVKFEPTKVVSILRDKAPGAVKAYLEYLVFGKNHTEYVNELITYYMDIVISKLSSSDGAREMLIESYETYRALRAPKPTYRQFIADNAVNEEWWDSRLRLLQLLGGTNGAAVDYDVATIRARIEPYTQELVPESILLYGREARHEASLKLLTHSLGDYDTAIRYCLLGGSSIYNHAGTTGDTPPELPSREEQAQLFGVLLAEFLRIRDVSARVEQTSSLLERFGGWLDVGYVLSVIPDTWSVELVSGFLVSALRRVMRERSETMVAKSLSAAENLRIAADVVDRVGAAGPQLEMETTQ